MKFGNYMFENFKEFQQVKNKIKKGYKNGKVNSIRNYGSSGCLVF